MLSLPIGIMCSSGRLGTHSREAASNTTASSTWMGESWYLTGTGIAKNSLWWYDKPPTEGTLSPCLPQASTRYTDSLGKVGRVINVLAFREGPCSSHHCRSSRASSDRAINWDGGTTGP